MLLFGTILDIPIPIKKGIMHRLLIAAFVATSLTSCVSNRIYFTVDTKKELDQEKIDLKQIQFYNSEEIVLVRSASEADVQVEDGKVKTTSGKQVQEIVIPAMTPGICEVYDERSLRISFDDGDGNALPFLVERREGVVVDRSGFKLAGKNWKKTRTGGKVGKVDYQKELYTIVRGANSRLLIDKSSITKIDRSTKVARGRKL